MIRLATDETDKYLSLHTDLVCVQNSAYRHNTNENPRLKRGFSLYLSVPLGLFRGSRSCGSSICNISRSSIGCTSGVDSICGIHYITDAT